VLSVAVIGAGRIASKHLAGIIATKGVNIAGIADVDLRRARDVALRAGSSAVFGSIEACLESTAVDGVIICTPTESHYAVARTALEARKHVLIEKPMCMTLSQAKSIVALAREQRVKVMVAQTMRFMQVFDKVKQTVDSGALGQPLHVIERRLTHRNEVMSGWKDAPRLLLGHWGSHAIDLCYWLFDTRAVSAFASTTSAWKSYPGEDDCLLALRFGNGMHGGLHYSFHSRQAHHDICIVGTRSTVEVDALTTARLDGRIIFHGEEESSLQQAFSRQMGEFVGAIVADREPVPSGTDALDTMCVLEAAYESALTGTAVRPIRGEAFLRTERDVHIQGEGKARNGTLR